MSAQQPMRLTNRRGPIQALVMFFVALIIGQWIPTEIIAASGGFNPWFGPTIIPGVYAIPFAWLVWWWRWYQPLARLLAQPLTYYGPRVDAIFAALPYYVVASLVFALIAYVIAYRFATKNVNNASDLYDPAGRWATIKDAERLGLLKPAGPIIGAGPLDEEGRVETWFGKVALNRDGFLPWWAKLLGATLRLLRAAFPNHLVFQDKPGGGKSTTIQFWLTVPLQDARARRVIFSLWDSVIVLWLRLIRPFYRGAGEAELSHRRWTAEEKRMDDWGEEPEVLITDLKGEFAAKSAGYQHDALGKRTEVLAPIGLPETVTDVDGKEIPYPIPADKLACYNPFWSARLGTDSGYQNLYGKVKAIVERGDSDGKQDHWDLAAEGWGTAVLEHLAFVALNTGNFEMFSPCGLMDYLSAFRETEEKTGETADGKDKTKKLSAMDVLLRQMKAYEHDITPDLSFGWQRLRPDGTREPTRTKPSIFNAADAMLAKDVKERTSVWSSFLEKLNLFRSDVMRRYTSKCTFEWKASANAKRSMTLYYVTPSVFDMADIEVYSAMVIDDFLRDLTYGGTPTIKGRSVRANKYPALAIIEEAYIVAQTIPSLEKVAGVLRGYGVRLIFVLQSLAQANKMWGKQGEQNALVETVDTHLYGSTQLPENAQHIERNLGYKTKVLVSENLSGDRWGFSPFGHVSEQMNTSKEPLMTAKQIATLDPKRAIGIIKGFNFMLRRAMGFENPRSNKHSQREPVISCENTVSEPFFVRSVRAVLKQACGDDSAFDFIAKQWTASANGAAAAGEQGNTEQKKPEGVTIGNPLGASRVDGGYARVVARSLGEALAYGYREIADADAKAVPKEGVAA